MRKCSVVISTVVFLTLLAASIGPVYAITRGQDDGSAHPYVGMVLVYYWDDVLNMYIPEWYGSGVMISPTVMLTAGHLTSLVTHDGYDAIQVYFAEDPTSVPGFPFAGGYWATEIHTHPLFGLGVEPGLEWATYDVGVLEFDPSISLPDYGDLPSVGQADALKGMTPVDLVGYGTQFLVNDHGNRYWVGDYTRQYAPALIIPSEQTNSDQFLALTANPGKGKGGTAFGDSGGPVILQGTDTVLGLNSWVTNYNCAGVTYAQRVDIPGVMTWISLVTSP